jgi:hypothetical protein
MAAGLGAALGSANATAADGMMPAGCRGPVWATQPKRGR